MGMLACYQEADTAFIDRLKTLKEEDLFEEIEEIQEEGDADVYDMDKLWDGLHCLLTGVSACEPIEGDLLSEAVVSTELFYDEEDSDFITFIYPERLKEIVAAMDAFGIDQALEEFSPAVFDRKEIYPSIWEETEKEGLRDELHHAFQELKEFYHRLADKQSGVVVSIY